MGRRLPIIIETLQTCKNHIEPITGTVPTDFCEALEKILEACNEKARRLRQAFEKVISGENSAREKRYVKVFKRLGKGNKVEELMASITEEVRLLVNHRTFQSATTIFVHIALPCAKEDNVFITGALTYSEK